MTAEQSQIESEQTLAQKMQSNIEQAELRSAQIEQVEVRVYKTKTRRQLANGEFRDYVLEHRYVPIKKAGPCKTELIKQQTKLRADVKSLLHGLSMSQLADLKAECERLVASNQPTASCQPL